MNCDKCGKKYSITANMSKRSNDGLCIDCSRESRRKRREQQVEQERMGPLPSFLQGKDGQKEQVRRKPLEELERPLNYSASPVTSTAENENVASWKRRYPSLSTHLELGKFMIQVVTWIAAIGIIVITIKECRVETGSDITFEPFLYGVAAEISLAIFYIANMASIEFIKVICSIEQESVLARLERQDGTQAVE